MPNKIEIKLQNAERELGLLRKMINIANRFGIEQVLALPGDLHRMHQTFVWLSSNQSQDERIKQMLHGFLGVQSIILHRKFNLLFTVFPIMEEIKMLQSNVPAKQEKINPMRPDLQLLVKLGSIIIHAEELISPDGHAFDREAMQTLLQDAQVRQWLEAMDRQSFLPVKRNVLKR